MSIEKFWKSRELIKKEGKKEIAGASDDIVEEDDPADEPASQENIPEELLSTDDFLKMYGEEAVDEIHEWYENAITRRDREPLEYDRFRNHFFEKGSYEPTYMFGDMKQGYLMGFVRQGAFLPTHFAPKSLRKGYELVQELGKSKDIPAVMMITDDLVKTITKFPDWKTVDRTLLVSFLGEDFHKIPVYNNHPEAKEAMIRIAGEQLADFGEFDETLENIISKARMTLLK